MKCPICDAAELTHDIRDLSYSYKNKSTTIVAVEGEFCPTCAEAILDMPESIRVMNEIYILLELGH